MTSPILVLSRATPHHHTGGMETIAWNLAVEWSRAGRRVSIITTAIPGQTDPFVEAGVEVVPLPGTRPGVYSAAWWRETQQTWNSLDVSPAVVLSVSAAAFSVLGNRSRHPSTPFVMQAHGTSAMEIASKLRARTLRSIATAPKNAVWLVRDLRHYRAFDRIVAVGRPVADSLFSRPQSWFVEPDKVCVISNGVRLDNYGYDPQARKSARAMLGIQEDVAVVVSVGRLHVQKRLDRAVLAAAHLRDRGHGDKFRMLLVGDGPDEIRLRNLVAELRLTGMVHFVGRIAWDKVRDYYSAADVALMTTTRSEGAPLAVPEALACGLPCIVPTGYSTDLNDVVHEVDAANPGQIADTIYGLTQKRGSRESLLPDRLTLERCASTYLTLFDDLQRVVGA